jgi:ribosomal protein S18 acetylase RimI-like enzyme
MPGREVFDPGKGQASGYAAMVIRTRPAVEPDRPFLSWLEEACMREYSVALWGAWRPRPRDEQSLDGCRIIVEGEEGIGCVTTIARPDHVWIDQLYVSPRFQRKGIGSTALRMVLSEAAAMGVPVKLSVIVTNPALDFYQRHGLRIHEETPERRIMTT